MMKKKGEKIRKNKEEIQFIYLTLKSGKKTISRKVIERVSSAFSCLARETWFRESMVFVALWCSILSILCYIKSRFIPNGHEFKARNCSQSGINISASRLSFHLKNRTFDR